MPKKAKDLQYYEAVGRRREAVARVRLYIAAKGKTVLVKGEKKNLGDKVINDHIFSEYFTSVGDQNLFLQPLTLTENADRFFVSVKVLGGGKKGQVDAVVNGISRALCLADESYRPVLRQHGLLTRDPRAKERRKVGTGGKARRQKQSPKR